jgi:anaerobic selenocysteine-containing dehydrogenase
MSATIVKTTTWSAGPGCHGGCGVLAHVKDGKVIKVEGDPDHPWNQGRLCARCLAVTQYMYNPDRITHPLKRVGPRGEGKWERIGWDEAFDIIEKRLGKISEEYGAESVVFLKGTGRDIGGQIQLLAFAYGSPNVVFGMSGISCYAPRNMVTWATVGEIPVLDASQWLPKRYDDPEYEVPKYIMVWGQNIQGSTCPDAFFGHWIVDLMKRGSKLIVIEPSFTWLSSRAKVWLQIRPGTDGALALGFLHIIINEGLYDHEFVKQWTNGSFLVREDTGKLLKGNELKAHSKEQCFVAYDRDGSEPALWDPDNVEYEGVNVKPALEGSFEVSLKSGEKVACKTVWTLYKEQLAHYTPEKVSEITGVPQEQIVEAARLYAEDKPAAIHWGLPIDTMTSTTPTSQAIAHLWAVTGNLDIPGGNVIARYSQGVSPYPYTGGKALVDLPPGQAEKRIGYDQYGALREYRQQAQTDLVLDQMLSGDPYPIKGLWIQTSNMLAGTSQDPRSCYEAMQKMDFMVCVDLFLTPTAMMADVFLPAATFLEKEGIKPWWTPMNAIKKVVTVGECKSDWEINLALARRFRPDIPWENPKELFDHLLQKAELDYEQLCEKDWIFSPEGDPSTPYFRYQKGLLRPDGKPGFTTPSGKIELFSSILERWGLEALPYYEEPPFSPISTPDLYKKYPLIMMTGKRSPAYFHTEHRQVPWLRELDPVPIVEIHPETAAEQAINNGESVWIENQFGRCKAKAKLTPILRPDTIMVAHGWWFPEQEGTVPHLYGIWDVNVNQLIPTGYQGKAGFGAPVKSMLCKIYKE